MFLNNITIFHSALPTFSFTFATLSPILPFCFKSGDTESFSFGEWYPFSIPWYSSVLLFHIGVIHYSTFACNSQTFSGCIMPDNMIPAIIFIFSPKCFRTFPFSAAKWANQIKKLQIVKNIFLIYCSIISIPGLLNPSRRWLSSQTGTSSSLESLMHQCRLYLHIFFR